MSIDILSCEGHAPVIAMDEEWFPRVLGFYYTPEWACLEILDPDDQPVMVPLQEYTSAATVNAVMVYYVAMRDDSEIISISVAPANSARTDAMPVSVEVMTNHATDITNSAFSVEFVDLSSVGKVDAERLRRNRTGYGFGPPNRSPQSKHYPPPS